MAEPPRPPAADSEPATILLLAGRMKMADRVGHHDYAGGCALLAASVAQTAGVRGIVVRDGWPEDAGVFDTVRCVVCYCGGGGKHELFASPERVERIQALIGRGVGLVLLHQAVRVAAERASSLAAWAGGAHVPGTSARGHWRTHHRDLPVHPVTRGVAPWTIRDGWLREIRFVDGLHGVVPLVWSSRAHGGSSRGGAADVVSWAYERPGGGRSFCYTGLDAHSAWSVGPIRQLVVNGVLWSAGVAIPDVGAPCAAGAAELRRHLTPRQPKGLIGRLLHRWRGAAR
ncbi:MAG: ThuA domain-containing protein [Candidatus Binatia bacterium]